MPRAGPLRYWFFTFVGVALALASAAAFVWGIYHLIGTESCGTRTTQECSSETGLHILAVVVGPFFGGFGMLLLALRGGGTKTVFSRFSRREKRLADRIARGEAAMPTVRTPPPSEPVPSLTPLNSTWPPATWSPQPQKKPTTAAAPPRAEAEENPIERLNELARMKDKGLITPEEFEARKKQLLGGV